jgi:hypothetical protein
VSPLNLEMFAERMCGLTNAARPSWIRSVAAAVYVPSACLPIQAGTDHDTYRAADAELLGMARHRRSALRIEGAVDRARHSKRTRVRWC